MIAVIDSRGKRSASRSIAASSDFGCGQWRHGRGDSGDSITAGAGAGSIGLVGGSGIDRYNSARPTPNPIAINTAQRLAA